jgi:hypothetical protein
MPAHTCGTGRTAALVAAGTLLASLAPGGASAVAEGFRPELCAFELSSDQVVAGGSLSASLELVNTGGSTPVEHMIFMHVRPASAGVADAPPATGADFAPALPTYAWAPGGVVTEQGRPVGIPGDFPPGRYNLFVGMYDLGSGDRVAFANADLGTPDRRYLVGVFDILAPGSQAAGQPLRRRWRDTAGLPTALQALAASPAGETLTLQGAGVRVVLATDAPRVLRYEFADGAVQAPGYRAWPARVTLWRGSDGSTRTVALANEDCAVTREGATVRYAVTAKDAGELAARFTVSFALAGQSLRVTVGDVVEEPGHELMDVYLPPLAGAHGAGGALVIPNQGGRLVPVAGDVNGQATIQMDWMVGDLCGAALQGGALAAIRTRDWDNQLRAWAGEGAGELDPRFALRAAASGGAARVQLATEASFEVGLLQDEDGDGQVSWVDAAEWLRRDLAGAPSPLYHDCLIYKIFCDTPGPQVVTTYQQALDIIRAAHDLAPWQKQVVYLVGWQFQGHDTGYPATDVFNPRPGGLEGLQQLSAEAAGLNAVLSYHDNFDDAYVTSPAWDESVIARGNDGKLQAGGVWAGGQSYILAFAKYAERYGLERVRRTLSQMPVRESYHIDVLTAVPVRRDYNPAAPESTRDSLAGKLAMVREFNRLGVDITSEGFTSPFVGVIGHAWHFWHRPDTFFPGEEQIPFVAFIYHGGPTDWGNGAQTKLYAQDSALQGAGFSTDWTAGVNPHDMAWSVYMVNVPWAALRERKMEGYRREGAVCELTYGPDTFVRVNQDTGEWRVVVDGQTLVDNGLVVVRRPGLMAVYSPEARAATVTLSEDLRGRTLKARNALTGQALDLAGRVAGNEVSLALSASEPVLVEAG